jgi:hypothetical protein
MEAAMILRECSGTIACYAGGRDGFARTVNQDYARRHARARMEVGE